jgi:hypothetical protein
MYTLLDTLVKTLVVLWRYSASVMRDDGYLDGYSWIDVACESVRRRPGRPC